MKVKEVLNKPQPKSRDQLLQHVDAFEAMFGALKRDELITSPSYITFIERAIRTARVNAITKGTK